MKELAQMRLKFRWIAAGVLVAVTCLAGCVQEGAQSADSSSVSENLQDGDPPVSQTTPSPASVTKSDAIAVGERALRDPSKRSVDGTEQIGAPEPKSRQRSTLRAGGVRDITFDDIEFDIEPDEDYEPEMLTDKIRELDGKKVIIRGFMDSSGIFATKGIKQFVLIRDNSICCFGPGAKIYHNIQIDMDEGKTTEFPGLKSMQVDGVFSIRPWKNLGDGKVYSVFHIQASRAK